MSKKSETKSEQINTVFWEKANLGGGNGISGLENANLGGISDILLHWWDCHTSKTLSWKVSKNMSKMLI